MAKKIIIDSELLEANNNILKEYINRLLLQKEDVENKVHISQDIDNIQDQYPSIEYLQKYYHDNKDISNLLNNLVENLVEKDNVYTKAEINELFKNFECGMIMTQAESPVDQYDIISNSSIECAVVEEYEDISNSSIESPVEQYDIISNSSIECAVVEQNNNTSTVLIKEEVNMDE